MTETFTRREEVEAYVQDVLQDRGVMLNTVDVAGVVDTLHQVAGGTWDVQHLHPNIFWATVTRNQTTTDTQ